MLFSTTDGFEFKQTDITGRYLYTGILNSPSNRSDVQFIFNKAGYDLESKSYIKCIANRTGHDLESKSYIQCTANRLGLGLWCLTPLSTIYHLYRRKSLTNFITLCSVEYTSPRAKFALRTLVVISADCILIYKSNYHTTTTVPVFWRYFYVICIEIFGSSLFNFI